MKNYTLPTVVLFLSHFCKSMQRHSNTQIRLGAYKNICLELHHVLTCEKGLCQKNCSLTLAFIFMPTFCLPYSTANSTLSYADYHIELIYHRFHNCICVFVQVCVFRFLSNQRWQCLGQTRPIVALLVPVVLVHPYWVTANITERKLQIITRQSHVLPYKDKFSPCLPVFC